MIHSVINFFTDIKFNDNENFYDNLMKIACVRYFLSQKPYNQGDDEKKYELKD